MSITAVQTSATADPALAASWSVVLASTTTSGNLLVVTLGGFGTGTGVSVTDNHGNTFAQAAVVNSGSLTSAAWYCANIVGGASHRVTVATSSGTRDWAICVTEYSGAATASALDTTSTGTATGTAISSGSLTTAAGNLIVGTASQSSETTLLFTDETGWTSRANLPNSSNWPIVTEDLISTGTAVAATFTMSGSATWTCVAASFKAAAPAVVVRPEALSVYPNASLAIVGQ